MIPIRTILRNKFSSPNKNPILILGFPKSGTSAITGLLSRRTGLKATIDTKYLWEPYLTELLNNRLDFKKHIKKHSYPFSKSIIKEPNLVFLVDELLNYYKNPKVVIIKRDKAENIKSILDRLKIPGDLKKNPKPEIINKNWRSLLLNEDRHYIESLSYKFDISTSNLEKFKHLNPIYVNYKEFKQNKILTIDKITNSLDLKVKNDVSDIVNKPFQPKSQNHKSIEDFFGDNLKYI